VSKTLINASDLFLPIFVSVQNMKGQIDCD